MTITATEAYEAMLTHHARLGEELNTRAESVSAAVTAGRPYGSAMAALIAYLAEEVLPHAAAEEKSVYPAAAAHADMAGMVGEMVAEHIMLSALSTRLAAVTDPAVAAGQAEQITALFAAHVSKENDVLLPALLRDESVDLGVLLEEMHASGGHKHADDAGSAAAHPDSQAAVVSLLIQAAAALARTGDADRACTIAVGQDTPDGPAGGGTRETAAPEDSVLDVRELAPARRHETIFAAYRDLAPGAGFLLVNDHDPKPLRYQFEAEHAGEYAWDYQEAGPKVWRVRIGRPVQ